MQVKGEAPAIDLAKAMINFASDPAAAKARLEEIVAAESRLDSKQATLDAARTAATRDRVKADQMLKAAGEAHAKAQAELAKLAADRERFELEQQKLADRRAALEAQSQDYAREHALVKARGKELAAAEEQTASCLAQAESDRTKAQAARNEVEQVRGTTLKEMAALQVLLTEVSERLVGFRDHL